MAMLRSFVFVSFCIFALGLSALAITTWNNSMTASEPTNAQSSEKLLLGRFDDVELAMTSIAFESTDWKLLIYGALIELTSRTTRVDDALWGAALRYMLCDELFGKGKRDLCSDVQRANDLGGMDLQAIYAEYDLPLSIDHRVSKLRAIVLTRVHGNLSDPNVFEALYADVEPLYISAFAGLDRPDQVRILDRLERLASRRVLTSETSLEANFRHAVTSLLRKLTPKRKDAGVFKTTGLV